MNLRNAAIVVPEPADNARDDIGHVVPPCPLRWPLAVDDGISAQSSVTHLLADAPGRPLFDRVVEGAVPDSALRAESLRDGNP